MTTLEEKIKDFREYFDRTLKPKKASMKNLDREIIVDLLRTVDRDAKKSLLRRIELSASVFRAAGYSPYADSLLTLVNELEKDI